MYFEPILPLQVIYLLLSSAICIIATIVIMFMRVNRVSKACRSADKAPQEIADEKFSPVSVVIYSQGDADNLLELLKSVLAQDYPAPFEVIVVNEGEKADVRDTITMIRANHPNVYLTFTPEGVRNLSRKKLGLTLGVKAARYPIVVHTTTSAMVMSKLWLRRMVENFFISDNVEVVLGYAYVDPSENTEFGKRRRAFDYVAEAVRWISSALAGHPFRGQEFNLAYRKETFMRNKGFARSFNICDGDDDIFVSEVATKHNTKVVLSTDSMVRLYQGNDPRVFGERMVRRAFSESQIHHRPRILFGMMGWLQILALILAMCGAILQWQNILSLSVAALLALLMFGVDIFVWRKVMKALKSRRMFITIPWFAITLPIRRTYYKLKSKFGKQKKYTWD